MRVCRWLSLKRGRMANQLSIFDTNAIVTWIYRSLRVVCLASYSVFYGTAISWRLPISGLLIFAAAAVAPEIGTLGFVALLPILFYLNQYPQQQFSAAT